MTITAAAATPAEFVSVVHPAAAAGPAFIVISSDC